MQMASKTPRVKHKLNGAETPLRGGTVVANLIHVYHSSW
jgi:hypothetical protein